MKKVKNKPFFTYAIKRDYMLFVLIAFQETQHIRHKKGFGGD